LWRKKRVCHQGTWRPGRHPAEPGQTSGYRRPGGKKKPGGREKGTKSWQEGENLEESRPSGQALFLAPRSKGPSFLNLRAKETNEEGGGWPPYTKHRLQRREKGIGLGSREGHNAKGTRGDCNTTDGTLLKNQQRGKKLGWDEKGGGDLQIRNPMDRQEKRFLLAAYCPSRPDKEKEDQLDKETSGPLKRQIGEGGVKKNEKEGTTHLKTCPKPTTR